MSTDGFTEPFLFEAELYNAKTAILSGKSHS